MLNAVRQHMDELLPQWREKHFLVAISGGVDSVTLTHLLKDLGCHFSLAHCNFNLRGAESEADQEFVEDLSSKLGLDVYVKSFDTLKEKESAKGSVQMVARDLRYAWFAELMEEHSLDYLVTAHQADDDLETFLINSMRGTGLRGLTGINALTDWTLRPLLPFDKQTVVDYAKSKGYHWREDSSNQETSYLRNQLRLEVIPRLKQIKPELGQTIDKTLKHLKGSQSLVDDYMQLIRGLVLRETDSGWEIDLGQLAGLPHPNEVLYELLSPFGFTAWEDIYELQNAQSGKQIFSPTHRLIKDREVLILDERRDTLGVNNYFIQESDSALIEPISLNISAVDSFELTNANTVFLDKDKLNFPLQLRPWKEGDFFYPFGMEGRKKLSKYFKDEKLSLTEKENLWLLCSDNEIVWVIGHRMDERFKVERDSSRIIKIEYTP
ncbi:tRNA lysidine(34) synthetase TilS [Aureitalea marina]|uniref:tRNA(Ile)-lysidine synthase n=1 Tax=Aureitalea marina TaxID=930804 RepID=A0A2S7KND7_9FLAO|nr:tRNA lysidine(34) synthetase TilS [Aureitalea marina]PQB04144.1 tRNA lysidine(34) synthetase TilS [Aureitalea marina]